MKIKADLAIFVENVEARCKEKGVTSTASCVTVGLSRTFLSDIKKKGTNPCIGNVQALAKYFECSVSDLLGDGPTEKIQLPAKDQELLDAYHNADYDTRTIVDLALKPYKKAAAEAAV